MADAIPLPTNHRFQDLAGHRFGRLVVVALAEVHRHHYCRWRCRCQCGNETVVRTTKLTTGKIRSCGCMKRERTRARFSSALLGKRFGRLLVLRHAGSRGGNGYWECVCDCGNQTTVATSSLKSWATRSCGCLRRDTGAEKKRTHGMTGSAEYRAWHKIKSRCFNANDPDYHRYGGRGITIHEAWRDDFAAFYEHIGHRPSPIHSVDRINNDGHYEPGNVQWATDAEQSRNRRCNRWLEHNGERLTLTDWARRLGITPGALHARVKRHGADRALNDAHLAATGRPAIR